MSNFNWGKFLTSFVGYTVSNFTGGKTPNANIQQSEQTNFSKNLAKPNAQLAESFVAFKGNLQPLQMQNFQMNNLAVLEKSLYFKNVLNFPKEITELVQYIQSAFQNATQAGALQNNLKNANILNLAQFAQLLQLNGKEAVTKLITEMANASKQGINDVSQLKDLIKLINASVSTADQNPSQAMKTLMLLYLPWLPLKESTGYDLEVENTEDKTQADENSITVLISTKNYGNIKANLMNDDKNTVLIDINCFKKFPHDDLKLRLNADAKKNSAKIEITFAQNDSEPEKNLEPNAKIFMANDSKINQLLVFMAHSIIKNVIEIDKEN